jgi:YkoP domain
LRRIIRSFDDFLRRQIGVFEFPDEPDGILRGQFSAAAQNMIRNGRRIAAGSSILNIHIWNEHVPPIPQGGPDLAWAAKTYIPLMASFRKLARRLKNDPAYARVEAISGETVLVRDDAGSVNRLFARLGFSILPYHNPLGRFGEFWENFYTWWIMWAFNQVSLRNRRLLRMRRNEIWISREDFLRRYG